MRSTTLNPRPHGAGASASAYALYSVSKNASATCPTIVDPTGLDWPSPDTTRGKLTEPARDIVKWKGRHAP